MDPPQTSEPRPSKSKNLRARMWKIPASGGATVLSPGMNLASSNERAPCLAKMPSVRRTQESGSREILQRNCRMRIPFLRPRMYHTESAERAAMATKNSEAQKLRWLVPANAPAAKTTGSEGIGRPSCSAKTQASRTTYPCLMRNSSVLCIEPGWILAKLRQIVDLILFALSSFALSLIVQRTAGLKPCGEGAHGHGRS